MIGTRLQILRVYSVLMLISIVLVVQSAAQESTVIPPIHKVVSPDPLFNEIRSELLGTVEHRELPSLAVGVIYEGRILCEEAFGWADKENNVPATTSTPYGLASVGKSITATGVMTLVE